MSEQERLLEHEYDGIKEFDNPTPRWWTWIFWGSVAFSIAYWLNPGGMFRGERLVEYEASMAAAEARWPKQSGGFDLAAVTALRDDGSTLALGKSTYATYCAPCHRPDGGGIIGPNLTDDHWLHGGTLADIHRTIAEGVLEKGMPGWNKTLKPEQLNAVTLYVASLHGTNPPNPKAPQGEAAAGGAP
jgi:cytochrome c oxidase cbb3-type subunit 3